mmetsp:Transcript_114333/g.318283  ORF Transcript_114333/g.318283 Transcript_114333/m.318283 type:complete len:231 (-) Transcript_114333:816-1508(-)
MRRLWGPSRDHVGPYLRTARDNDRPWRVPPHQVRATHHPRSLWLYEALPHGELYGGHCLGRSHAQGAHPCRRVRGAGAGLQGVPSLLGRHGDPRRVPVRVRVGRRYSPRQPRCHGPDEIPPRGAPHHRRHLRLAPVLLLPVAARPERLCAVRPGQLQHGHRDSQGPGLAGRLLRQLQLHQGRRLPRSAQAARYGRHDPGRREPLQIRQEGPRVGHEEGCHAISRGLRPGC